MKPEQQEQPRGKILVVDDEAPIGELLQQWLVGEGYDVCYAPDFSEVQRFLGEEPFDLVTLDIMMPEVDGLQVLGWIREHYPDVGVVMATALGDLDTVLETMRGGAINYLIKPFNLELVSEEVARAMERQQLIAENRAYQRELEQKVEERTRELKEAHVRLEHQVRELEGRDRLVQLQISPPADFRQAYEQILRITAQTMEASGATIYRPAEEGGYLEAKAALGRSAPEQIEEEQQLSETARIPVHTRDSLVAQVFVEGRPEVGGGGEMATPVLYNEETLGVLQVDGVLSGGEEAALNILWRLGREVALVLRMMQIAEDLERGEIEVDELLKMEEEVSPSTWDED